MNLNHNSNINSNFFQKSPQVNQLPFNMHQKPSNNINLPYQTAYNNNIKPHVNAGDKYYQKNQKNFSMTNVQSPKISTSQVTGGNISKLDALLKESEKFLTKDQINKNNMNSSNGQAIKNIQIQNTSNFTNNKLNSSSFESKNQQLNFNSNSSKVVQSYSHKNIHQTSKQNAEQKKSYNQYRPSHNVNNLQKDANHHVPSFLQKSQRSISSNVLTNYQKKGNLSLEKEYNFQNSSKMIDLSSVVSAKNNPTLKITDKKQQLQEVNKNKFQSSNNSKYLTTPQVDIKLIKLELQNDQLKRQIKQNMQNIQRQNSQKNKALVKIKDDLANKNKMCDDLNKLLKLKYSQVSTLKEDLILSQKKRDQALNKLQNFDEITRIDIYEKRIYNLSDELHQNKTKVFQLSTQVQKQNQTIKQLEQKVTELKNKSREQNVLKQINTPFINSDMIKNADSRSSRGKVQLLSALDEALKVQLKQIQELKAVIEASEDQKLKLRQNLLQARRQVDVIRNEMTIIELKANSQRKNIITQYRLQIHEKQNQINDMNKKIKTLQEKYKNSLIHIKSKDEFLSQHLIGRTNQIDVKQYIQNVLQKYSQNFDSISDLQNENKGLLQKLKKYEKYQNL